MIHIKLYNQIKTDLGMGEDGFLRQVQFSRCSHLTFSNETLCYQRATFILLYFYTEKVSASNILSYLCFTKDTAKIQSPMKLVKNYFQMFTD